MGVKVKFLIDSKALLFVVNFFYLVKEGKIK